MAKFHTSDEMSLVSNSANQCLIQDALFRSRSAKGCANDHWMREVLWSTSITNSSTTICLFRTLSMLSSIYLSTPDFKDPTTAFTNEQSIFAQEISMAVRGSLVSVDNVGAIYRHPLRPTAIPLGELSCTSCDKGGDGQRAISRRKAVPVYPVPTFFKRC